MHLTWKSRRDASCWHAIAARADGRRLLDGELDADVAALIAAAGGGLDHRTIGDAIASGSEPSEAAVRRVLGACRQRLAPGGEAAFDEELRLRAGPLRGQWDARGPGLLREFGRLTEPAVAAPPATIELVVPVVGGYGCVFGGARVVTFEAVLANPHDALPEVLRLAWLLARLSPAGCLSEGVSSAAALLPAVLAAGEQLELTTLDTPTLELAAREWLAAENPLTTAAALMPWWQAYRGSPTPWAAAVAELDGRLA